MSGTIVGRGFRLGDPFDIRLECAFHVWTLLTQSRLTLPSAHLIPRVAVC